MLVVNVECVVKRHNDMAQKLKRGTQFASVMHRMQSGLVVSEVCIE